MTFSPNFISRLVTTALIIPMGLGGVSIPEAKAAECVNGDGWDMCFESTGVNRWDVVFQNNHVTEVMDVQCVGKSLAKWQSQGGMTKSEAREFAKLFCSF